MPVAGKRQTQEQEETPKGRRFGKVCRPYRVAADGLIGPTEREIAEGKAHKRMSLHRGDKQAEADWLALYDELCRTEGLPATTRCARCHVVRYGRSWRAACGFCGLIPDRDARAEG